jgi:hypothetical protein
MNNAPFTVDNAIRIMLDVLTDRGFSKIDTVKGTLEKSSVRYTDCKITVFIHEYSDSVRMFISREMSEKINPSKGFLCTYSRDKCQLELAVNDDEITDIINAIHYNILKLINYNNGYKIVCAISWTNICTGNKG